MSQQPTSNISVNGSNPGTNSTGGEAAHIAAKNARTQAEVKSFNEVFGYTTTQNYGFGENYAHETSKAGIGNSCIRLVTFDATDFIQEINDMYPDTKGTKFSGLVEDAVVGGNNTYYLMLTALLEELPEISFSYEFTEGPGTAIQDRLATFADNPAFGACAAIGTVDSSFKNIVRTGTMTNELWNGVKESEVKLKFKIYTADTLGQTDPDIWIKALSMFATPSTANQASLRNYVSNIISGVKNISGVGQGIFAATDAIDARNKANKQNDPPEPKRSNGESALPDLNNEILTVKSTFDQFTAPIKNIAANISDMLTLRFGNTRVFGEFNRLNALGEKLWALYLYDNFLFKQPLTVFVKDWSVKPSNEINTIKVETDDSVQFVQRPVYYEFNITCALDQVYSKDQWNYVLQQNLQIP